MKNLIITVEFAKKLRDSLTAVIGDTGETPYLDNPALPTTPDNTIKGTPVDISIGDKVILQVATKVEVTAFCESGLIEVEGNGVHRAVDRRLLHRGTPVGSSGLSQPENKTADRFTTMQQLLDACPDDPFMPDFDVTLESHCESPCESPVGMKISTISRMSCS